MEKFVMKIQNACWQSILAIDDVNVAVVEFLRCLDKIYCSCFPLKVKYIGLKRVSKPWLTPQLLNEIKYKSQIFKQYKLLSLIHI